MIYVRPGYEVDLDSLVQDAIRLNSVVKVYLAELQIMILQVGFQKKKYIYFDNPQFCLYLYLILQDTCSELCEKSEGTIQCKHFFF